MSRQINRENTPCPWYVADRESSLVCLDAALTNCEPESQAGSVVAALRKRQKHLLRESVRKTAAVILDVDPDAIRGGVGVQRDFGVALRELKSVLQQVPNRREEHFPVHIERKTSVNIADRKTTLPRPSLKRSGDFHVGNEVGEGDQLVSRRHPRCYSHVSEGSIYEAPHPYQRPIQHGSRRAG
jgi:hypothetical protein